jgi:lipopolysaccharide/colanic/teichoic acid biosynthesis glycosyltransferase
MRVPSRAGAALPSVEPVRQAGAAAVLELGGHRYPRPNVFRRAGKRALDAGAALVGLVLTLPLFAVIALLIKLDSPGPVFFRQVRVGRYRRPFRIWKFRKFRHNLAAPGPNLTTRYDFRMTRVGRFLERTKLDELPQLLNVLWGDMSLVGPRPPVPKFLACSPEWWDEVLAVKPGVFGPNQITYRNESALYPPGCEDVEGFYLQHLLPGKLAVDRDYARHGTLARDLWLIGCGVAVALLGSVTGRRRRVP